MFVNIFVYFLELTFSSDDISNLFGVISDPNRSEFVISLSVSIELVLTSFPHEDPLYYTPNFIDFPVNGVYFVYMFFPFCNNNGFLFIDDIYCLFPN